MLNYVLTDCKCMNCFDSFFIFMAHSASALCTVTMAHSASASCTVTWHIPHPRHVPLHGTFRIRVMYHASNAVACSAFQALRRAQ